jgi:uncharacterized membrane protein
MSRSMFTEVVRGGGTRGWLLALMFLSVLGLADSGYLYWRHYRSTLIPSGSEQLASCPAGGCDLVTQGEYAEVRGIPLAAIGLAGYLTLLCLAAMAAWSARPSAVGAIAAISGIGVVVSAFLVYLQVAVIRAICSWCILSVFTMASIFILSVLLLRQLRYLERLQSAE